jgi:TetR/AcrR family transcriptional repressor of nem operon
MASALVHDQLGLPSRRKDSARERILDLAEASVLQKGFASTSIEELIVGAGITKSGFFYHFKTKSDLARALIERYLERDEAILGDIFARADELTDDPLHGVLVGLKMFAEIAENLPDTHPGCLVASYCYQEQLFSQDVRDLTKQSVLVWRKRFREKFDRIVERYPPRHPVDLDALADMMSAVIDGGITLSKTLKDPAVLPQQILLYRQFVRSVFQPD